MAEKTIRVEIENGVAVMVVSRSDKANAFDLDMLKALDAACEAVEKNADVRVAVLTGEGRSFSAGGDIKAWGGMRPEEFGHQWVRYGHRVFERLATLRGRIGLEFAPGIVNGRQEYLRAEGILRHRQLLAAQQVREASA